MKTRKSMLVAIAAAGLFVTGAMAQHEEHHNDQTAAPPDTADTGKMGGMMSGNMMSGNMMSGNMMSHMPPMMMGQNETAKLVDQLMKSFAVIEAQKHPTALNAKLAEHGLLLKDLQAKVEAQSHMMEMMQHMMDSSKMGGEHKN